jgi:metal-responsive CopG/Arc/MetJ family transcriptional regulator
MPTSGTTRYSFRLDDALVAEMDRKAEQWGGLDRTAVLRIAVRLMPEQPISDIVPENKSKKTSAKS